MTNAELCDIMILVSEMRHERSVKMVNVNKLKGKIVENGMSIENLATVIGVDRATIYRKLNGNGASFSIKEADSIVKALSLNATEAQAIFFSQFVS